MGVILLNKRQVVVDYIRADNYGKAQYLKQLLEEQVHVSSDWDYYSETIGGIDSKVIQELIHNKFFSELNDLQNNYIKKWLHLFNIYYLMQNKDIVKYLNIIKVINLNARLFARKAVTKQYAANYPKITVNGREEIVLPMFDYLINYAYRGARLGVKAIDDELIFPDYFYRTYEDQIAASSYEWNHVFRLRTLKSLEVVFQEYYKYSLTIRGVYTHLEEEILRRESTNPSQ